MIIGHKDKIELFENLRASGELPHALLFAGPQGVGKRAFAFVLAHWLQEDADSFKDNLSSINESHPDIHETSVPLSIKEVKEEMRGYLATSPYSGNYKVVIINDADKMHRDAANSLLKTLEEPPGDTVLILITENPNLLLETIRSRCYVVNFGLVNNEEIEKNIKPPKDLKNHWSGRPGIAARLAEDFAYAKQVRSWRNDLDRFIKADIAERFQIVEKYAKMRDNRSQLANIIRVWTEHATAQKEEPLREDMLKNLMNIYKTLNTSNANAGYLLHSFAANIPNKKAI